ncbi:MAG: hypothetical protein GF346_09775, partial [Candidatus Eisenbacteria bacterium]|nr:hypothetical protein [Candidatus Latescibacterota bacterium]MBD3302722.1 hypothetical protein [Candidatus Eisenbacteria bacterium]
YVVVLREADASGTATFNIDDHTLTTDARHTVLHFGSGDRAWSDILAGLMVGGSRVWYDDRYVMGIYNDPVAGDLTFDAGEVVVAYDEDGSLSPEYYVGPVIPDHAVVDGVEQPIDMVDLPHPLRSTFPNRVCRSPNNDTVPAEWQYTVEVYLRTGEGEAVSGWPVDRISMDLQNCPNPRFDLAPDGPSDLDGRIVWTEGLDTGGSHQIAGVPIVLLSLDYPTEGMRTLHTEDSITSPDEDGDMDVDEDDFTIWNQAFENEGPLYIGDLNRDDAVTWDDYYWMEAHGLEGEHYPPPAAPEVTVFNPARHEARIICGLPSAGRVRMDLFDVGGRLVRTLLDEYMTRGGHPVHWDGRNEQGARVGSGIYLLRMQQGNVVRIVRIVLLR